MPRTENTTKSSVGQSLQLWREAERAAAGARRGRLAAETAAAAALEAAEAASATAEAASSALASMKLVETSAAKTATAARLAVESSNVGLVDADEVSALADLDEAESRVRYGKAVDRPAGGTAQG